MALFYFRDIPSPFGRGRYVRAGNSIPRRVITPQPGVEYDAGHKDAPQRDQGRQPGQPAPGFFAEDVDRWDVGDESVGKYDSNEKLDRRGIQRGGVFGEIGYLINHQRECVVKRGQPKSGTVRRKRDRSADRDGADDEDGQKQDFVHAPGDVCLAQRNGEEYDAGDHVADAVWAEFIGDDLEHRRDRAQ